eukprot:1404168-Prymnesium_polylepis.1
MPLNTVAPRGRKKENPVKELEHGLVPCIHCVACVALRHMGRTVPDVDGETAEQWLHNVPVLCEELPRRFVLRVEH